MENQRKFQTHMRIVAFMMLAFIVVESLLWIPAIYESFSIKYNMSDSDYPRYFNLLAVTMELFFIGIMSWMFALIAQQSKNMRPWLAAAVVAFCGLGIDLFCVLGRFVNFMTATDTYLTIQNLFSYIEYFSTFLIIIAFILVIVKIPHQKLIFSCGLAYIIIQFLRICYLITWRLFLLPFLFLHQPTEDAMRYVDITHYILIAVFFSLNLILFLFLLGLSRIKLPVTQNAVEGETVAPDSRLMDEKQE